MINLLKKILSPFTKRAYDRKTQKPRVSKKILKELEKGIKKGESIPNLAKRVQKVSDRNKNSSLLIARTETTRIQNTARFDAIKKAEKMGIKLEKEWVATNDSRTRDTHVAINHEVVGLHDTFSNGLAFPGDPNGAASEVCNCRCTLISKKKGGD